MTLPKPVNYLICLGLAVLIISICLENLRVQCTLEDLNIAESCSKQCDHNSHDNHVAQENLYDVWNETLGVRLSSRS